MENKIVLTITEISEYIKNLMESDPMLGQVWLKGEISNFKRHSSGHLYLTLKDGGGVLRAVMFRGAAGNLLFEPKDGMKVMVRCKISVYPASGNYQAYISEMEQDGVGDLHAAFEALKQKLHAEGLFAPEHKKPIPRFPSRVGIVTSPTGAALQDMKNVMGRRFPYATLAIYPALVQGDGAAEQVMEGIRYFNNTKSADVIIIGRGGGSIEDLWAFNSEELARVIYASEIPIISAVGHEIDFTISDFAADRRAPTPSAAAELAVPDVTEVRQRLENAQRKLTALFQTNIQKKQMRLEQLSAQKVFARFADTLNERRLKIDEMMAAIHKDCKTGLQLRRQTLAKWAAALEGYSPLGVMQRGYGILQDEQGNLVRKKDDVKSGDTLTVTVTDGKIRTQVL